MSLSDLIRKKSGPAGFATATLATFATHTGERGRTVASVATVAVAKSTHGHSTPTPKVSPTDTATAFHRWLLHFPDREPVQVICCPDATHAEILERHPDAVAAEPFTPTLRQPSAPLTADEEKAIRAWLVLIEEPDIDEVLADARARPDYGRALLREAGRIEVATWRAHDGVTIAIVHDPDDPGRFARAA